MQRMSNKRKRVQFPTVHSLARCSTEISDKAFIELQANPSLADQMRFILATLAILFSSTHKIESTLQCINSPAYHLDTKHNRIDLPRLLSRMKPGDAFVVALVDRVTRVDDPEKNIPHWNILKQVHIWTSVDGEAALISYEQFMEEIRDGYHWSRLLSKRAIKASRLLPDISFGDKSPKAQQEKQLMNMVGKFTWYLSKDLLLKDIYVYLSDYLNGLKPAFDELRKLIRRFSEDPLQFMRDNNVVYHCSTNMTSIPIGAKTVSNWYNEYLDNNPWASFPCAVCNETLNSNTNIVKCTICQREAFHPGCAPACRNCHDCVTHQRNISIESEIGALLTATALVNEDVDM